MSKMACICGRIISDTHYPSQTEGWVFREQDQEMQQAGVETDIAAFLNAIKLGLRNTWIASYFSVDYPNDINDASIIGDIISKHEDRFRLSIAECDHCGRLHVQRENDVNSYVVFSPDIPGYAQILKNKLATSQHYESNE